MPLLHLSLAFLLGILLAATVALPAVIWFAIAAASLLLAAGVYAWLRRRPYSQVAIRHSPPRRAAHDRFTILHPLALSPDVLSPNLLRILPLLALSALALGAARYQSTQPVLDDPGFIAAHNDTGIPVTLTGVLAEPPDERDTYTNLRLEVETLRPRDGVRHTPVRGLVLARVDPGGDWQYGDRLTLTGLLETPPEDKEFSYRDYLARQGVYSYMPRARAARLEPGQGNPLLAAVYRLKQRALSTVYQLYPDPEASLLAGILLGVETGITPELKDAFRDTGTAHIVAISGFNITIVAAIFTSLFGRLLGKRGGAALAIIAISLYTLLVGADAAVVRAALMGALVILARQINRPQSGLNALTLAAAIMAFANPRVLWDAGFQLSFAATLGLLLYAEPLTNAFRGLASRYLPRSTVQRLTPTVSELFLLTLAAQITTLPVIVYQFQRISLISFLANPLVLPVQPLVMILGGLAVLLGLLALPLGKLLALPAWVLTAYTIRAVEWMAKIPGGVAVLGPVTLPVVVLLFGIIAGLTLAARGRRPPTWGRALASPVSLLVLLVLAALTWRAALSAPDGQLRLTLLDVGPGDALLIRTPTGRWALIDGGPSTLALSNGLGRRIPPGQRQLDFLIVAATGEQNLAALPRVVERFPPASVLWSGLPNRSAASRRLQETLIASQTPIITAQPGHALDLGRGAALRVLAASKTGAVLLLEWGNFRALLPIGLDFDTLDALRMGKAIGPVSVLLLAQNGYAAVNPPAWIANLRPQLVLLSVDAGNRDGLPSPETLAALQGYNLLRSDQNGWIEITTDGKQMWVSAEKR